MIQILGLRETDKGRATMRSFGEAPSAQELFAKLEDYIAAIPEGERWNIHYTVASVKPGRGRQLESQNIIPFDIDDIDPDRAEEYIKAVVQVLGVDPSKTGITFTGHGLHFLVQIYDAYTENSCFEKFRDQYKLRCKEITAKLALEGLPGHADDCLWKETQMLRMPETTKIKEGLPDTPTKLMQRIIEPQDFKWGEAPVIPELENKSKPNHIKRYPKPDDKAVIAGCEFLKSMANTKRNVPEPEWYAALSIVGRLNDKRLPHTLFSKNSPGWDEERTQQKVDQACAASGPRTCDNINSIWGGCNACPHWGTGLASPILLKSEEHIATEATGFRKIVYDNQGRPKPGEPVYDDLKKFYERKHKFITVKDTEEIYTWLGTHWEIIHDAELRAFAQDHIEAPVKSQHAREFLLLLKRSNQRDRDFFTATTEKKLNLTNGVYNLETNELEPHTPGYGFRHVLPYEYNPTATAPRFKQFLQDVTCGDKALEQVLLEFMGFTITGHECDPPYALFLVGEGSNGKSTFLDIFRAMVGEDNTAGLLLGDLGNQQSRDMLDGKLVNIAEETAKFSMVDNSAFKVLTSGGKIPARKLYQNAYTLENRAKFVFACNELPKAYDPTMGMFRRLLLVPFEAKFTQDAGNIRRGFKHEIIEQELPGILNLVLEAYQVFAAQKEFSTSQTVIDAIESYRNETDSAREWIKENLWEYVEQYWPYAANPDNAPNAPIVTEDSLWKQYRHDLEEVGRKPMDFLQFCKKLHEEVAPERIKRRTVGKRKLKVILGAKADTPTGTGANY